MGGGGRGVRPQLNHPDDKLSRSATRMPLLIDGRAMDGAAALEGGWRQQIGVCLGVCE